MNSIDTSYKSELYFDVIIKRGTYKGWRASFVGLGRMEFTNGKKIIKVKEKKPNSKSWMKECWNKFIEKVKEEI